MGRLAEATPPTCPCWDIEAVRQAAPTSGFPCQAKPEVAVYPGGPTLRGAVAESRIDQPLNNGQNVRLEARIIKVKEEHQAWCKCLSNPPITGCAESEIKDLDHPDAQACINEITQLCRDIRQQ